MAYPTHQQYADLAKDAYENRRVTGHNQKGITIGGNEYKVLAVADDRRSGYQGTVYLDLKNNAVIVAHHGTESPKKGWRGALTDAAMVFNRDNGQPQSRTYIQTV